MNTKTIRCSIAIVAVLSACDVSSKTQAPNPESGPFVIERSAPATCGWPNGRGTASNFAQQWACGTQVRVLITSVGGSVTQAMTDAVTAARQAWNTVFVTGYSLPQLVTTASSTTITVKFDLTTAGNYWCGAWSMSPSTINIVRSNGTTCPVIDDPSGQIRIVTDLTSLLKHEFSHAVGFRKHLSNSGATSQCTSAVPYAPTPLNSSICDHERQAVWWMYGLRNTDPDVTQPMIHAFISLNPASATVNFDATQEFAAVASPEGYVPQLTWGIQDPAIASFTATSNTGATVLAGHTAGQTQITVEDAEGSTLVWPPATALGTLTVQAPPPPPPPPVESVAITPNSITIVFPNDGSLTATAYDAQGNVIPNVTWEWSVRDTSIIYFVPSGGSAWVAPKRNGSTQVFAFAGGQRAIAVVTVQNCPTRCNA